MPSPMRDIGANYEQVGAWLRARALPTLRCVHTAAEREGPSCTLLPWPRSCDCVHTQANCTAEWQLARGTRDALSLMHPPLPPPTQLVPHGPPSR